MGRPWRRRRGRPSRSIVSWEVARRGTVRAGVLYGGRPDRKLEAAAL